jgi:hypothetical protein
MPGLVPGTTSSLQSSKKDVDGRVEPGHDENDSLSVAGSVGLYLMWSADFAALIVLLKAAWVWPANVVA